MDMYNYAMQIEKESERYYREVDERTGNKELRTILARRPDADVEHYNTLLEMKMKRNETVPSNKVNAVPCCDS
jgi:rubrerythrin